MALTQITCYVLVPAAGLSAKVGEAELASATHLLAAETRAHPRKTEHGTLLVTTPAGFGQDIAPIAGGDLRETWPFIVLNTALRRLGCGGRAAMGNDAPVAAVRRKFYESYRVPAPGAGASAGVQSRAGSPPQSPTYPHQSHKRVPSVNANSSPNGYKGRGGPNTNGAEGDAEPVTATTLAHDTLMLNVVELVKLIQGALAAWGLFGSENEDLEIDGLFCDVTKAGLFSWRRAMGMEREESLRLERETSGGCIDPRTLAALLSSITSTRYQLDVLGVEKLPKDPFSNPRRFVQAWRGYQSSVAAKAPSPYLSVGGLRQLKSNYLGERRGHVADAFKVPRVLLSGVASAASGVHATLKGGTEDSTPLRKREQHLRFNDDNSGVEMIVPEGEVGPVAAPDVITTGLEPYVKGVLTSREKDWDVMGARHVAELWNGTVAECATSGRGHSRLGVFNRRARGPLRDYRDEEDDGSAAGGRMGTIRDVSTRAGNKLKDLG